MKISVCVCSCRNTPIITTISKTISAAMRKRFNAPLAALPGLIFREMADNKAGGLLRCCTLHTREEKTIDANFYALLMREKYQCNRLVVPKLCTVVSYSNERFSFK